MLINGHTARSRSGSVPDGNRTHLHCPFYEPRIKRSCIKCMTRRVWGCICGSRSHFLFGRILCAVPFGPLKKERTAASRILIEAALPWSGWLTQSL